MAQRCQEFPLLMVTAKPQEVSLFLGVLKKLRKSDRTVRFDRRTELVGEDERFCRTQ